MKQKTIQNIPYAALVKFEVKAAHFSPSYTFSQYSDNSAADVIASIIDEFLNRVDDAISCEDGSDDDILNERNELEQNLREFSDSMQTCEDPLQIENLYGSICIGYPTYEFSVVTGGTVPEFVKRVLQALEDDTHFSDFMECQLDKLEDVDDDSSISDKGSPALDFQRLHALDPEELNEENVGSILSRIEELVCNKEM